MRTAVAFLIALAAGWHEAIFNRPRTEPPCYLVLAFKPRASRTAAIEIADGLRTAGGAGGC